jgi:ParB family chromosome partitioning protein
VGKARATVANLLRLLELAPAIREMIADGKLSAGHAKVLLGVEISAEREALAKQVVREQLSVRALEYRIAKAHRPIRRKRTPRTDIPQDHLRHVADVMHRQYGTSVRIQSCRTLPNGKKAKGTIEIDYFSADELDRLLSMLGVAEEL